MISRPAFAIHRDGPDIVQHRGQEAGPAEEDPRPIYEDVLDVVDIPTYA